MTRDQIRLLARSVLWRENDLSPRGLKRNCLFLFPALGCGVELNVVLLVSSATDLHQLRNRLRLSR